MIDLKLEITVSFISIKTGNVIYSESLTPFDLSDEKALKNKVSQIYRSLREIQIADEMEGKNDL